MKFILFACCLFAISILTAQTISADSQVRFEISSMGFKTVDGTVEGMTGSITFDPMKLDVVDFNVCVDAKQVKTGNAKRDDHLQKDDWFNTEAYPEICITSTSVSKTDDGYLAKGSLTMMGVTREIDIPFTFENNTFLGSLQINRIDYNLGEKTGTFMVGDEVDIQIVCKLQ